MKMGYQRFGKQSGNNAEIFVIIICKGKAELTRKLQRWNWVGSFWPEFSQRFFEKLAHIYDCNQSKIHLLKKTSP
jgi:hypothetical protein